MNNMMGLPGHGERLKIHIPLSRIAWLTAATCFAVILGLVTAEAINRYSTQNVDVSAAASVSRPSTELPPEWKWSPQPVKYEHMYRSNTSAPKADFIRHGGAAVYSGVRR